MFGLSEAHYNIVKQHCRKCSEEITAHLKKGIKYDAVAAEAIDKHYGAVKTLITRMQFVWLCGYLNGRFGQKGEYE